MDKTAQTELHRLFIVDILPEPLTTASAHLQIFDTYIPETRLRVRQMRDPATNSWTRLLQQRFRVGEGEHAVTKLVEIHLDDDEFAIFERMHGAETRKNRYFHEFNGRDVIFDVYLGALRGLITAKVAFDSANSMERYEPAPFMNLEVTGEQVFESRALAERTFEDIQNDIAALSSSLPRDIPED